jgi:biotin transport system substrate-specific component
MSLLLTSRPTIVDRLIPRSLVADIALVAAGTGLTAAASQLVIATSPVPITGQTFAVLLVGAALGRNRAAISMFLYLLLGAFGVGVFSEGKAGLFSAETGQLTGTLGYIVGFIFAAALVGYLAERGWSKNIFGVIGSFVAGNLVIYSLGLPWLQFTYKIDWATTLSYGFTPFILWDLAKLALAVAVLPAAWLAVKKIKG